MNRASVNSSSTRQVERMTLDAYMAEAERRFGPEKMRWRFVCPACGHIQTPGDYKAAGAPEGAIGVSCVGRWLPERREAFGDKAGPGPCNYAGLGLFRINPVIITDHEDVSFFALAPSIDEVAA